MGVFTLAIWSTFTWTEKFTADKWQVWIVWIDLYSVNSWFNQIIFSIFVPLYIYEVPLRSALILLVYRLMSPMRFFLSHMSMIRVYIPLFTVRKRSCGKVMFLHLSVILFTGEGGMWRRGCMAGVCVVGGDMHARGHAWQGACVARGVRGRRDGHCNGRYAPYWNTFLFRILLVTRTVLDSRPVWIRTSSLPQVSWYKHGFSTKD